VPKRPARRRNGRFLWDFAVFQSLGRPAISDLGFAGAARCRFAKLPVTFRPAVSGGFSLFGTIGQPDAGVMEGGGFKLTGGFWFETPPGDCNETGLVDLHDYFDFDVEVCITGPTGRILPGCECFDVDHSDRVNLRDFDVIQASFTSP